MAETTRPGPLAGVRTIDFATVVMGPSAALIFADLGADVIKLEAPHDMLCGRERKSMSKLPLGELSEDPQVQEQLIEAVRKDLRLLLIRRTQRGTRREQLAVLTALAGVNRHNNNENKQRNY